MSRRSGAAVLAVTAMIVPALSGCPFMGFGKAYVRVAHLSADAPAVDVLVDGKKALENVPFKAISDYLTFLEGSYRIQVTAAGNAGAVVIDEQLTFGPDKAYTLGAIGLLGDGSVRAKVYDDDLETMPSMAKVRFVHASPDAPAVKVVAAGGPTLVSSLSFPDASPMISVTPGTYTVEVRLASDDTLVLEVPGVVLEADTNYSVFVVGLAGNGSLEALLVQDAPLEDSP